MTPQMSQGSETPAPNIATAAAVVHGILLVVLGIFAFVYVFATSITSVLILGALVGIGGAIEIVSAFRAEAHGRLLRLLSGVLSLVVGGLLLFRPVAGVAAVGLLLAGWFFASGLFRGVLALLDRPPRWGWDLAYGIVSVLLGVFVVAQWPASSFLVLGVLVAVELVSRGAAIIGASLAVRSLVRRAGANA